MDMARDLLFGVLAQRGNLIDADRLIDACRRWASHKDTPLADVLLERGWLTPEDLSHVEYLVNRNVARHGDARQAFRALADASTFRILMAVNDPELRRWVDETLPGLARHDADAEQPKRGLGVGLAAAALFIILGLIGILGLGGTAWVFSRQRIQVEMMRAEAARAEMDARMQQERAEANLLAARDAVDQMVARVADDAELGNALADPAKRELLEKASRHYEDLLKGKDIGDPDIQKEVAPQCLKLAEIKIRLGKHEEAARIAMELGRILPKDGQTAYDAARLLARCAALAEKDTALPQDKRSAQVDECANKAMRLLVMAKASGYFETPAHRELLEKNKDFDRLRGRQEFLLLLDKSPPAKD